MEKFLSPEVIWFLIGLVLFLMEFALPGFIIAFFGAGAWVVSILNLVANPSINMQLLVFILSSVILLLLLRRYVKGLFIGGTDSEQDLEQKMDDFIGQKVLIVKEIKDGKRGKVEFHGTFWDAESDEDIEEGQKVEIVGKESIVLKVKKI